MNVWKWILIGLYFLGLGMAIADHGKPRKPNNALETFIGFTIVMLLLYLSGFFGG